MRMTLSTRITSLYLCASMVIAPGLATPGVLSNGDDPPPSQAQFERDLLRRELASNRELLQALLKLQSAQGSSEAKQAIEKAAADEIAAARHLLDGAVDFGSANGQKVRDELKRRAAEIAKVTISATTPKKDVDLVLEQIDQARKYAERELKQAQRNLRETRLGLSDEVQNALGAKLDLGRLRRLGDKELRKALSRLDPSIPDADLKGFATSKLVSQIADFSDRGRWSPELIAQFGKEKFEDLAGVAIPEKDATQFGEYVGFAAEVVDIHRSSSDHADFARSTLSSALSTGNPYVIAATVAILALISLFKDLFGGGGDGNGKGNGKKSRNTGAGVPVENRQPGGGSATKPNNDEGSEGQINTRSDKLIQKKDKPLPGQSIATTDADGALVPRFENGSLTVYDRKTRKRLFACPLAGVKGINGGASPFASAGIRKITKLSVEPNGFKCLDSQGGKVEVQQCTDDSWIQLKGYNVGLTIPGSGEGGQYSLRIIDDRLQLFEGTEPWARNDRRISIHLDSGAQTVDEDPFPIEVARIQMVFPFEPDKGTLRFAYRLESGELVDLTLSPDGDSWVASFIVIPEVDDSDSIKRVP